jgi:tetratricopeptide (TPR) repeat protein
LTEPTTETRQLARLLDGIVALEQGHLGIAKFRFDEIVGASKGKPQLEAGHAWRALAEISIRRGDVAGAEESLKHAVRAYREVARVDPTARARAGEGEGAALLLGAELLLRRGLTDASKQVLYRTAEVLAKLGDDRSAEAWAVTGRLALHLDRPQDADRAFQGALSRYEKVGNVSGHAEVLLEAAALKRDLGDVASASRMLDLAATMARNSGRLVTVARAHIGRAQLANDREGALEAWEAAFRAATSAGDVVTTGFALLGLGANGWQGGEQPLLAGSQLLLDGGHFPGLGLGLQRIGEYAVDVEEPEVALVACEGAWRVYRGFDPVDGLGRVLRVAVKAFAGMRQPRPTLVASFARAALVGQKVPHAVEVRDHYANLAPRALTMRLSMMPGEELVAESRKAIQQRIVPALRQFGLLAQSFATAQGALDVLGVMLGVSPRGAVRALVPAPDTDVPDTLGDPTLPDLEDLQFGRRTTLRINVAVAADSALVDHTKSPVYDPEGRLAALASQSLVFVEDAPPTEESEGPPPQARTEIDELFPEDSGVLDWMKVSAGAAEWHSERSAGEASAPEPAAGPSLPLMLADDATEEAGSLDDLREALAAGAFPKLVPSDDELLPTPLDMGDPDDEPTDPRIQSDS